MMDSLDEGPTQVRACQVPLVESTRGDLVESIHYGSFAVVDAAGACLLAAGDPQAPVYARSTLKPLQSVAMVRAGLDLPEELLALSAASHSGAAAHQDGAERILSLHGLDATVLRNVSALPYGVAEREAWLRAGGTATRLAQNCSGKHAAMVATCVLNGWTVDDYLEAGHPLQKRIKATITELTGEETAAMTIDGCGTPLFAHSLIGLARSYAQLGSASPESPEGRVAAAMRRHPEMVAGEGRDVARLMRAVPGLFAKDGAEAVQLFGLADGRAAAIKISDGGDRARLPITVRLLEALGIGADKLAELDCPVVLGGGSPVGVLRPASAIDRELPGASSRRGQG